MLLFLLLALLSTCLTDTSIEINWGVYCPFREDFVVSLYLYELTGGKHVLEHTTGRSESNYLEDVTKISVEWDEEIIEKLNFYFEFSHDCTDTGKKIVDDIGHCLLYPNSTCTTPRHWYIPSAAGKWAKLQQSDVKLPRFLNVFSINEVSMMPDYVLDDVLLPLRISSGILCLLDGISNSIVAFLSIMSSKFEKVDFASIMQVAVISNIVGTFSGFIVLNRCRNEGGGAAICIPLGPGTFLGARFNNLADAVVVQINSYAAVMVGWMMFIRCMILYDIRFKKRTLMFWTAFIVLFPTPQYVTIAYAFTPITELSPDIIQPLESLISGRTSYALQMWMWSVTSLLPLLTFFICILIRIVMEMRIRKFSENLSFATRKIHRSFMNLLTIEAVLAFIYYICCDNELRANYFPLLNDVGYPLFSIPVAIQGFAYLYYVPNLRNTFRKLFKNNVGTATVMSVSHTFRV